MICIDHLSAVVIIEELNYHFGHDASRFSGNSFVCLLKYGVSELNVINCLGCKQLDKFTAMIGLKQFRLYANQCRYTCHWLNIN
jgi:hypothetical protein